MKTAAALLCVLVLAFVAWVFLYSVLTICGVGEEKDYTEDNE